MIRIVLIEDDDLMREWLGRSLSSRGHEVDRYRRADEAIEAVSADPPDVIVSDIHMPGMSGIELGQALRARGGPARPFCPPGGEFRIAVTGVTALPWNAA